MNTTNYSSVSNCIEKGSIGDTKVIRVFKNKGYLGEINKEIFTCALYEDLSFIYKQLGEIKSYHANSTDNNFIIIMKHTNGTLSHMALNFFPFPISESFRVEAAGDNGLVEFDSESRTPIISNVSLHLTTSDFSSEKQFLESDNNEYIIDCLNKIYDKSNNRIGVN